MPRRHFFQSAQPWRVRASSGSAGTSFGQMMLTMGDPDAEQRHLDDARPDGARIHVADGTAEHVGKHDQNQRGRDELGDGAGCGDDAHSVPRRVAVLDHRRHRDHAHGDDGGRDGAGDGAQDGADENHRIGQAPAHRPEQLPIEFEQVLGEATALQNRAHECEERDGEQQVVGDDAEQLVGEIAEKVGPDEPQLDADEAEEEAGCRQRECGRKADQHEEDHAAEHQGRHVLADEMNHCSGFSYSNCSR